LAVDQRILDKFAQEFADSQARAAEIQLRIDGLNNQLVTLQGALTQETTLQAAMNETLAALGQPPLS
jgi:hypothetical protein